MASRLTDALWGMIAWGIFGSKMPADFFFCLSLSRNEEVKIPRNDERSPARKFVGQGRLKDKMSDFLKIRG